MSKEANKKNQRIVFTRMAIVFALVVLIVVGIANALGNRAKNSSDSKENTKTENSKKSDSKEDADSEESQDEKEAGVADEDPANAVILNPDGTITGSLFGEEQNSEPEKEEVVIPEFTLPDGFEPYEKVVYTKSQVNLRTEPSTKSEKITTLDMNMPLQSLGSSDKWYLVYYNNQFAYVANEFIVRELTGPGAGKVICIDPGHQMNPNAADEPIGPGNIDINKQMATSGETGVATGTHEYYLTQLIANGVKKELLGRGYAVVLTRESSDMSVSNAQRAKIGNDAGADLIIHLHAAISEDPNQSGAFCIATTTMNPYCGSYSARSVELGETLLTSYCASTGMANLGVVQSDDYASLNYQEIPGVILEMGFLSNASDDTNMAAGDFEQSMVNGIVKGINSYLGVE